MTRLPETIPALLVPDPGRPGTRQLLARVMRSEFRAGMRRLSRAFGVTRLYDSLPEDRQIPDSAFAKQAIEYASALCPPYMMRHCFRSWCFGSILATRNRIRIDREVFFVSAMLHDLGLSEKHRDDPVSFEWVGAGLAHDFCLGAEQAEERAAMVHNAIALHTSVGIADRQAPETSSLHFGTGLDLFGMRTDEIPPELMQQILADYPRDGFRDAFSSCLKHEVATKPCCQFAGAAAFGIIGKMKETL